MIYFPAMSTKKADEQVKEPDVVELAEEIVSLDPDIDPEEVIDINKILPRLAKKHREAKQVDSAARIFMDNIDRKSPLWAVVAAIVQAPEQVHGMPELLASLNISNATYSLEKRRYRELTGSHFEEALTAIISEEYLPEKILVGVMIASEDLSNRKRIIEPAKRLDGLKKALGLLHDVERHMEERKKGTAINVGGKMIGG